MTDAAGRAACFLDRDGTLIRDSGYLSDPLQVELLPGTAEALRILQRAGYLLIVISNQSGIARRLYPASSFAATEAEMERQLAEQGVRIDAALHCPHGPDDGCTCRKPGTALHREAIAAWGIDTVRSCCIGDQIRDVLPAIELGTRGLLVRTGQGEHHLSAAATLDIPVADDLNAGAGALSRYLCGL